MRNPNRFPSSNARCIGAKSNIWFVGFSWTSSVKPSCIITLLSMPSEVSLQHCLWHIRTFVMCFLQIWSFSSCVHSAEGRRRCIKSIWYRNISFKQKQEWLKCKYLKPWPCWWRLFTSSWQRGVFILSGEFTFYIRKTLFLSDRANWPRGPSAPQLLALSSQLPSCCPPLMIQFTMDHQPPLIQPILPSGLE